MSSVKNQVFNWQNPIDRVLRFPKLPNGTSYEKFRAPGARSVAIHIVIWGLLAGLVIGSYGWMVGERTLSAQLPQMMISAIKIPLLLTVTVTVSLPFFFVVNSLMGLRRDFRDAFRAIISAQAGLAIILCSLTPFLAVFYVSFDKTAYSNAVLLNTGIFGFASLSAQFLLRAHYRVLIRTDSRHRFMVWAWIVVYAFVGVQVAWVSRPFIGSPNMKVTFFRDEPFSNAYIEVFEMLCRSLGF